MLTRTNLLALAGAFVLAGCGQAQDPAPAATASAAADQPVASGAAPAAQPGAPAAVAAAAPPAPLPSAEPGVYRNGNFAVRVESSTLVNDDGYLVLRTTLSFHNTGPEPMTVALLAPSRTMSVAFDNGVVIAPRTNAPMSCAYSESDCRAKNPEVYTQIDSNASVSANFNLIHRLAKEQLAALPSIKTGNLVLRMHVVEGSGSRVVQASILNLPVRNEIQ